MSVVVFWVVAQSSPVGCFGNNNRLKLQGGSLRPRSPETFVTSLKNTGCHNREDHKRKEDYTFLVTFSQYSRFCLCFFYTSMISLVQFHYLCRRNGAQCKHELPMHINEVCMLRAT
jgi:hypothetical protein